MILTPTQFASVLACTPALALAWCAPFNAAMHERQIDNPVRVAAFLAQVGHESRGLSRLEENLNYGARRILEVWERRFPGGVAQAMRYEHRPELLANFVYANRNGNLGEASGDGWRYRGRGPLQITGRRNYSRCGAALNLPLLENPAFLLEPIHGARSAAWFWQQAGCNACAGDVTEVTALINGGDNGLADRRDRFDHALMVLA